MWIVQECDKQFLVISSVYPNPDDTFAENSCVFLSDGIYVFMVDCTTQQHTIVHVIKHVMF